MQISGFKKALLATAAGALALMAGGAVAQETIKIGAVMGMTGALQAFGESSVNAITLAVEEINAQGGVLGKPLQLVVGDDQTNPQAGVDAATRLVQVEGVKGLLGALASGVSIPIATSVAKANQVPQISGSATSPVITTLDDDDYFFRTTPHDALQGVVLADVVKENGLGRVGLIFVNNDYGKGLADAFQHSFEKLGGVVTASVPYEEKGSSYRAELRKAAEGQPEALVLVAYPEDGIPILRQAIEGGFFARFVATDGLRSQTVIDNVGAEVLEGLFGTNPAPQADSASAQLFVDAYTKRFGAAPTNPFMDTIYDATYTLALAMEKAGDTGGAAVRDAIRVVANAPGDAILPGEWAKAVKAIAAGQEIDYVGAAGSVEFDRHGDVSGTYAVWRITGGKIETVRVVEPKLN